MSLHPSNIVIEIDSSPEPPDVPRGPNVRSSSKARVAPLPNASKGKGKGKAVAARKIIMGPVIELTDSESDVESKPTRTSEPQAGPSRLPSNNTSYPSPLRVRPKPTGENLPTPGGSGSGAAVAGPSKNRTAKTPLFLQTKSDEENEPPMDFQKVESDDYTFEKPFPVFETIARPKIPHPRQPPHPATPIQPFVPGTAAVEHGPSRAVQPAHPHGHVSAALAPVIPAPASLPAPLPVQNNPRPTVLPAEQLHRHPPPQELPVEFIADEAPAAPIPQQDPATVAIAQILEIIPDVEPDYLLALVQTHLPNFAGQTAAHVLGLLFEDPKYPRVAKKRKSDVFDGQDNGKGKGKERELAGGDDDERSNKKTKVDYSIVDRPFVGTHAYHALAIFQLQCDFPYIPKPYLRQTLHQFRSFYAPTYLALAAAEAKYDANPPQARRPYSKKSTHYNPVKDRQRLQSHPDEAFEEERRWLEERLGLRRPGVEGNGDGEAGPDAATGKGKGKERAIDDEIDEPVEDGTGIECQCCFSEYAFDRMVQCPEAHLFCSGCISQYASTQLGEHNAALVCMHSSGCGQPFPPSELRRVLSTKLMDLYERVKQQKEIEQADIDGLEECPFCEWKCVFDVSKEEEKLFRCGNEDGGCGEVSCRACKKKDHLPKTCKEVEEDQNLDGRHAIEEAMTRALMRNCPKCQKAFIKEAGCNKMTCSHCRTLSCYVCRQIITGYEHFDQTPMGRASTSKKDAGKCLLWDNVEERHAAEVKAAADKALEDYKRDHPDIEEKELKVDIPVAPPRPAPPVNAIGLQIPPYGLAPAAANIHLAQLMQNGQHPLIGYPQAFMPVQPPGLGQMAHDFRARAVAHEAELQRQRAQVQAYVNQQAQQQVRERQAERQRQRQRARAEAAELQRQREQLFRRQQEQNLVNMQQIAQQQQLAQQQLAAQMALANANYQQEVRRQQQALEEENRFARAFVPQGHPDARPRAPQRPVAQVPHVQAEAGPAYMPGRIPAPHVVPAAHPAKRARR